MMRRIMLFDRFDGILGDMPEGDVRGIPIRDVINGERSVTITTTRVLNKGERVVFEDARGVWHEYVVYGIDEDHASGAATVGSYYCVWSLQHDLMGTRVSSMPGVQTPTTAALALDAALAGTSRWERGTVTNTATGGASMYDMDGWSALSVLIGTWGGELDVTIEVGSTGVTARKVDLYAQMGQAEATRRFDFGADVKGIKRTIADGPLYCRITPRGKGEQTGDGYGRKVTIEDVNDGNDWLQNDAMVDLSKLPDGSGGWEYPTLEVENSDCETPAQLLAWAQGVLEAYTTPAVTYEVDVIQLAREGVDMQGVSLGDVVQVVDRKFGSDGLRLSARVYSLVTDGMTGKVTSITLGSVREGLASTLGRINQIESNLDTITSRVNTLATADYLDGLIDRLNTEINATGGYWYAVPGLGTRTYDVAVSDPAVGAEASKVVEIRGGAIRIANNRTSSGDWDWHTVFVSGHVAADLVTAANITAGYIGNATSGSYWDLDNDVLQIASTATIGTRTVTDLLQSIDATITDIETDIEYAQGTSNTTAPTSGWSETAPTWRDGYYIWQRTKNSVTSASGTTTTYSEPTCISGREGTDGVGISSTVISYGTSSSASTQPSTWSATAPTSITQGTWLWTRTAYTYTDASTKTVYSKSYVGTNGTDGTDGVDGTSVTVSSIQYGTSSSASTEPSSWSTTAPTSITKGVWLWVKTTYSDSTTATTKSYVGTDGEDGTSVYVTSSTKSGGTTTVVLSDGTTLVIDDGADGSNGTNGANGYVHVAWANSADGSTDFSTSVSTDKSYLGVYTDNTATDSETYSDYSWSKIEGDAGADGSDGVGITSIVEQYYLSTSSTSQAGGSWSTTQPEWQTSHYIWTRSYITWDDGTTTTTSPVLAGALNSANQAASDAADAASDAAKVATNYLTFNSTDGLDVGYSGTNAKTRINGSGMDVYDGEGVSTAFFGIDSSSDSYARIGRTDYGYGSVEITGSSSGTSKISMNSGTDNIAVFGYGDTHIIANSWNEYDGVYGTYVTLGTRKSESVNPGRNSFAVGNMNSVQSQESAAIGNYNTVRRGQSVAIGNYNTVSYGSWSVNGSGHAIGDYLNVHGPYVAVGRYNNSTSSLANNAAFVVGGGGRSGSSSDPWTGNYNAMVVYYTGNVTIGGTLTQSSDRRLKDHISFLGDDACDFVRSLKPSLFAMKAGGARRLGFYAQDVQDAEPSDWDTDTVCIGNLAENDEDMLALDYTALIAPLVAYAQSLEKRIDQQQQQIDQLSARLDALEGSV